MTETRSISEPAFKPHGALLVFLAACLTVGVPYTTVYLEYRAFSINPMMSQARAIMSLPLFIFLILPITLLILFLIRERFMHPLIRALTVLLPVLMLNVPGLIGALFSPHKPQAPFLERMGHPIPDDAAGFKAWFSHSPGESSYMFTFGCSAESTESLLAAKPYKLTDSPSMLDPETGHLYPLPIGGMRPPKGWPLPRSWNGLKLYSSGVPGGYCYLLCNADNTRVFILVGDT